MPDHHPVPVQYAMAPLAPRSVVVETFLNTLDSPRTKTAYRREVDRALSALGPLDALNAVVLAQYRDQCLARLEETHPERLSPASVLRHLAALRSFLKFARLTGQVAITNEVIQYTLKSPRAEVIKPYQILNKAERGQIVSAARASLRDRVLLEFALNTGLRASEICSLRLEHLIVDEKEDILVHVRQGKGRKDRMVPLRDETALIVRVYLKSRKLEFGKAKHAGEYLFPSRKGKGHGRISAGHLWKIVVRYARAAGITKVISPHSLRHTAAMVWLDRGAGVTDIQQLLGHASLRTTQKYLDHQKLEKLKDIVNKE